MRRALLLGTLLVAACDRAPPASGAPTSAATPAAVEATVEGLSFEQGRRLAHERRQPLLVEFHAPWCYSCYYMAQHVMTGPQWAQVRERAVVVEVDVDAPQGAALKQRYGIRALPSYLLLDSDGDELGRILGEQTREDFYAAIDALLARGTDLDALARLADGTDAKAVDAARQVLASWHARDAADAALAWFAAREDAVRAALAADETVAQWLARLRFMAAAQSGDMQACLDAGEAALEGELGCARAYELGRYLACGGEVPPPRARLLAQREPMQALVEQGAFGTSRCADERSLILTMAKLEAALGDREAQIALLRRAMADVERRLAGVLEADRNLADNLRVYVEQLAMLTGDYTALDALMPALIEAWPQDYVYALRHGRSLLARGQPEAALEYLERAALHAYGLNRLQVAEQRVRALLALDRRDEARRVVGEALKANGPWFAEQAAALKALLKT
ncbi:thioredoxin family protein [Sinimarinibacterium thermocellulolyticum]|uniref:Thioredoxin family protein n=1 Tax=Sinimarinibacterium thermocellulolyticum TaxID=3170016 RepID=A0ABV2A680_9GAMM